jgi:hypothetical protein
MLVYFYILMPIGKFYGNFIHIVVIWYIFPVLKCYTKKNLATLSRSYTLSTGIVLQIHSFVIDVQLYALLRSQKSSNLLFAPKYLHKKLLHIIDIDLYTGQKRDFTRRVMFYCIGSRSAVMKFVAEAMNQVI